MEEKPFPGTRPTARSLYRLDSVRSKEDRLTSCFRCTHQNSTAHEAGGTVLREADLEISLR